VPRSGRIRARLERHRGSPGTSALIGKTAEWLSLALLLGLLPRLLGPSDYGWFAFALATVTIGSASFSLGGPVLMARFLPAAEPEDRAGLALALARRVGRFRVAQIVLIGVAGAAAVIAEPERFPPALTTMIVVALALDAATTLGYQLALGLGHTTTWSLRYPIQNVGLLVAAAGLWAIWGRNGAVAAIPVGVGGALLVAVAVVGPSVGRPTAVRIPPQAMHFALLQGLAGFLTQVVHRGPMIAVVALTGSARQTGFVALAVGSALAVITAVYQYFAVHLPGLARRVAAGETTVELHTSRQAARATAALVVVSLAAVPLVDPVLRHVVGEDFADASSAFTPAIAALPFAAITALVVQISALRVRAELRVVATVSGAAIFCVAAAILVPSHGDTGAAWAFLAGTAAATGTGAVLVRDALRQWVVALAFAGSALVILLGTTT
jgi:O-antigen/teichoic acid export membrane protein